jgi:hypothetical protein
MNAAPPSCFFVLGFGRSGTTLYRRMLSAHPQLFVPPENDIFRRLQPRVGKGIADREALDRVLELCPPYYDRVYDLDAFRAVAGAALPLAPAEFYALLIRTARIAEGKTDPVWGHKNPSEWPYIRTLRRWYPDSRFLHIVRHPHDSTASMVQYQLKRVPVTPLTGAWQWRKVYRTVVRDAASLGPERYMRLRYEDLIDDPAGLLARTCRFLGVSDAHVGRMIDYKTDPSAAHVDGGAHMQRTNAPLTRAQIGRSASEYGPREIAAIDYLCRRELADLGYAPRGEGSGPGLLRRAALDGTFTAFDTVWAGVRLRRRAAGQL